MHWMRIFDPNFLIKPELVEQIRARDFDVKDFYKTLSLSTGAAQRKLNEDCYLYGLIDEPGEIVGFFWAEYDSLTRCLYVHYTSILKKYWNRGIAFPLVKEKLIEIMKERKIECCRMYSDRPKAMERLGFSKAKFAMHEMQLAHAEK